MGGHLRKSDPPKVKSEECGYGLLEGSIVFLRTLECGKHVGNVVLVMGNMLCFGDLA